VRDFLNGMAWGCFPAAAILLAIGEMAAGAVYWVGGLIALSVQTFGQERK
jgi:hypothetical protein